MAFHAKSLWDFAQRGLSVVSNISLLSGLILLTATWSAKDKTADSYSNILEQLETYLRRFLLLPDESLYLLVSLWVLGTHLHQQFDFTGYLFAHSPEPQSGKSRLLELLHEVTLNSSEIVVSPTPAGLFRTGANSTYLLDEVDAWTNKDDLKSVLNAGFQKGRTVVRMGNADNSYKAEKFQVYAPRALAGIGTDILDRVTRDRTFMIRMVRQKQNERRERFHPNKLRPYLDKLGKDVTDWVRQNRDAVSNCYGNEQQFRYLDSFQDRTIDVSQPLAAILEIACAGTEGIEAKRRTLVQAISITRGEQQSAEHGHEVLRELTRLAQRGDPLIGSASELAEKLRPAIDDAMTEQDVFPVLRRYDFKTKITRLNGEQQPRYRYRLSYAELKDLCDRYIGEGILPERAEERGDQQAV